jgi:HEPN domain-containing protein
MPPRLRSASDPGEWLCHARSNLSRCRADRALPELLDLVAATGVEVPPEVLEAKRLTPYAVAGRYPGVSEDASEQDYREALEAAEKAVAWAEGLVTGQAAP